MPKRLAGDGIASADQLKDGIEYPQSNPSQEQDNGNKRRIRKYVRSRKGNLLISFSYANRCNSYQFY